MRYRRIAAALVGPGSVGAEVLNLARERRSALEAQGRPVHVVGIARRGKCLISPTGIDLSSWSGLLNGSEASRTDLDLAGFVSELAQSREIRQHADEVVLIDTSTSWDVCDIYAYALEHGIHVVTANKRSLVGPMANYKRLHRLAAQNGLRLLNRTHVGAGMGFHLFAADRLAMGDPVIEASGVLGGTLQFVCSLLDPRDDGRETKPSEAVAEAQRRRYTDPGAVDFLGVDAQWKVLLILRAMGFEVELADVEVEPMFQNLPLGDCSNAEVVAAVEAQDEAFLVRVRDAHRRGKRLRYLASIKDGKGRLALEEVGPDHPAYELKGTTNMMAFTTALYSGANVHVLRGPGAGPVFTADGVLQDVRLIP